MTDANIQALPRCLVMALTGVPGVEAIAVGGPRARPSPVSARLCSR
jgi:hypothetical protein